MKSANKWETRNLRAAKRLYVLANRSAAVLYADGADRKFHFVERLANRTGGETEIEMVSDRPGRGMSSIKGSRMRHAFEPRVTKHEQDARRFAKKIAATLNDVSRGKGYEEFVLVAEPHFLGLLRGSLKGIARRAVIHEVHREFPVGSDAKLRSEVLSALGAER